MFATSPGQRTHIHRRPVLLLAAIGSVLLLTACGPINKVRLDREVDRLCAIDGGVKVFETVEVPAEYLPDGRSPFPQYAGRSSKERYGPDYEVSELDTYIVEGDPYLVRHEWRIVRKADRKILGSSVRYARVGGDLPGPWHHSSYACPPFERLDLTRQVFVKKGSDK